MKFKITFELTKEQMRDFKKFYLYLKDQKKVSQKELKEYIKSQLYNEGLYGITSGIETYHENNSSNEDALFFAPKSSEAL